jgi:hypothetical protein
MPYQMCWLCKFNTEKDAIEMHQFIQDNIGTMSTHTLAQEVHDELIRRHPATQERIDTDIIHEHIQTHTLNPTIRMGITLRSMLDLGESVRGSLQKKDTHGNTMGLDPKMIDAYIRIQAQIQNLYRSEPNKMLFNTLGTT